MREEFLHLRGFSYTSTFIGQLYTIQQSSVRVEKYTPLLVECQGWVAPSATRNSGASKVPL